MLNHLFINLPEYFFPLIKQQEEKGPRIIHKTDNPPTDCGKFILTKIVENSRDSNKFGTKIKR